MRLRLIEEVDKSQLIEPTVEWLQTKYNEMNQSLFDGKLKECEFEIFTSGKGMEGGILGKFRKQNPNLMVSNKTRQYYVWLYAGEKEFVNSENFVRICRPKILINGNYKWTEKALLSTLVHEMCHYYTYRNGYKPLQSHGKEFRNIAMIVSVKSKGIFPIERIASAEKMNEMELDSVLASRNKSRREKLATNKLNNIIATVIYRKNGDVWLTNAIGMDVVDLIVKTEKEKTYKSVTEIKICSNPDLNKIIRDNGYKNCMKSYRYWDITNNKELISKFANYDFKTIYP